MVVMAWSTGVTSSTIVNCWRLTGLLSVLVDRERDAIEKERFAARIASEIDEVGNLLYQLSLLSSHPEDSNVMDAQEFIIFEVDFDLNNSYEPTKEDILDMLPSEDLEIAIDEVMDDAVEDVVGFDVAEAAIHTLKRFLQQRPRDVSSRIKLVESFMQDVALARLEDTHQSTIDYFFERV